MLRDVADVKELLNLTAKQYIKMIFAAVLIGCVFIGLAFLLNKTNAPYLLTGYNTMTEEERRNFDLTGFLNYFKRFHLFLGASYLIFFFSLYFINKDAACLFLALYPLIACVVFIFKSRSFCLQKRRSFRMQTIAGIVMILVAVGVTVLFYFSYRENQIVLTDQSVNISGMYGEELKYSEIKAVKLLDTLRAISFKENGFAAGNIAKGYFRLKKGDTAKLILNTKKKPFLFIETADRQIYYSSEAADLTKTYRDINRMIEKTKVSGL